MFFRLRPLSSLRYCSNCSSMNRTTGSQLECGERSSLRSQGKEQSGASQACGWEESSLLPTKVIRGNWKGHG